MCAASRLLLATPPPVRAGVFASSAGRTTPALTDGVRPISLLSVAVRGARLADADRVRRARIFLWRVLLQFLHDQLDRLLELRVLAGNNIGRPLLDLDVRSDAFILDGEAGLWGPEGEAGGGDAAAVHQRRIATDADQPAPCPLANQR